MSGGAGLRPEDGRGAISYMARNGVAANLLMFAIIGAGVAGLLTLVQEVWREVSLDSVSIVVPYPGATPGEIEETIVQKIEEEIASVDGLKETRSTAVEGRASIVAEAEAGEDMSRFLDDVKSAVGRLQTLPADADRPEIAEVTTRQSVMRLVLHGNVSDRTLKELAYRTEDALASLPAVSYVATSGVRDYEVSIEVPLRRLRALGLTLDDVADAVRRGSVELSGGSVDTPEEVVRIRTAGQNYTQHDFEEIIVLSRADGTVVRLRDIARVRDGFADVDLESRYQGEPAAFVEVFRSSDQKVLEVVEAVERHLDEEIVPSLPAGVRLAIWSNNGDYLESRLGLLVRNGLLGLLLVLIALGIFLEVRLAWWVAVGIAVSFAGSLGVMSLAGITINSFSIFGFILALGIVVDDAIVVAENIHHERGLADGGLAAAIRGARRVKAAVIFAVLTTAVAFTPLAFVPGAMGKIIAQLPVVIGAIFAFSLIESLFVLPNHLSHMPPPGSPSPRGFRLLDRLREAGDARMNSFREGALTRLLQFAVARPGLVLSAGAAGLIVVFAMLPTGVLRMGFAPQIEGDVVAANLEMPEGTPASRTAAMARTLEEAGRRALERTAREGGETVADVLDGVNVTLGLPAVQSGPDNATSDAPTPKSNVAAVEFKLVEADERDLSAAALQRAWREETGPVPEAKALAYSAAAITFGTPVNIELSHADPELLGVIADTLAGRLRQMSGVFDIQTDLDQGLRELQLDLLPEGRSLGLALDDLADQVRAAFFGVEALRVQRGREEVRVYARLPEEERTAIADVEGYVLRTPAGGEVPLGRAASVRSGTSPTSITRRNGQRILSVTADVDAGVVTGTEVGSVLAGSVMPDLIARNPGLTYSFGGQGRQQSEVGSALGRAFILALLTIYALLAVASGSYLQPLVMMATIPFAFAGALIGHLILGITVTIVSLFGIIGLCGVVVNDSLVMIDFINEARREKGMSAGEAIVEGARRRFRPIVLTSVTTFLGVAPIVFETSTQAQVLVGMAAALGFGIIFAAPVLMTVVPALAMVHQRVAGRAA